MAGAMRTGLSVASKAVEARSSAKPPAIFASRSAEAGATIDKIGFLRQTQMPHLAFVGKREQIGIGFLAR